MNSKEIIVGRFYKDLDHPKDLLLGCGKRKMWTGSHDNTGEMEETNLVIISSTNPTMVGLIIKKDEDCFPDTWNRFVLI